MPLYFFSYSHLSCYILKILLCYISFFLIEGNVEKELEARTPHYTKVHFENKTLQRLQVSFSPFVGTAQTPPSSHILLGNAAVTNLRDGRVSLQMTLQLKLWCPACPPGVLLAFTWVG